MILSHPRVPVNSKVGLNEKKSFNPGNICLERVLLCLHVTVSVALFLIIFFYVFKTSYTLLQPNRFKKVRPKKLSNTLVRCCNQSHIVPEPPPPPPSPLPPSLSGLTEPSIRLSILPVAQLNDKL